MLGTPLHGAVKGVPASATLPRFEAFSPEMSGSSRDARLKVRLARLQFEAQEKELIHEAEYDLKLQIRKLEIEADKELKLWELEVETLKITHGETTQDSVG